MSSASSIALNKTTRTLHNMRLATVIMMVSLWEVQLVLFRTWLTTFWEGVGAGDFLPPSSG